MKKKRSDYTTHEMTRQKKIIKQTLTGATCPLKKKIETFN